MEFSPGINTDTEAPVARLGSSTSVAELGSELGVEEERTVPSASAPALAAAAAAAEEEEDSDNNVSADLWADDAEER